MRELTKKQKIKILNLMIVTVDSDHGLCFIYSCAMDELNYNCKPRVGWTPRFKELCNKIESEIKRTKGCGYINYGINDKEDNYVFDTKKWKNGRLKLLKDLRKEMK